MTPEMKQLLDDVEATYQRIYSLVSRVNAAAATCNDLTDLADLCFVAGEGVEHCDDLRKECQKMKDNATYRLYFMWLHEQTGEPIRTEYCTVTPSVKMRPELPNRKKNPAEFAKVMEYFAVPKDLWHCETTNDRPALDFNYNGMIEYVTRLVVDGHPLPPGLDATKLSPIYTVRVRRSTKGGKNDADGDE